ncbi:MAG: NAD(P)-dependent oxidoreductase [Deltaproteobacteria bacterium]|nr:NAD(P)-dependent oxidoreductase [Deltaproteobacteria bacterium]
MKVGVIGTGTMGKPMARNLLKAGYPLYLYARHPEKVRDLEKEGARIVPSAADVGRESECIVLSLPFDPDVEEVMVGEKGILAAASPGMVVLDTTTGSSKAAEEMAGAAKQRGIGYLDAPVSGGYKGAIDARLTFIVGGEEKDVEKAKPLMARLGSHVYRVGPVGAGRAVKALNQIIAALNTLTLCETVVLGKKLGISPETLFEVLSQCAANSYHLQTKLPQFIIPGKFDGGHRIEMMIKDLEIALQIAKEQKVAMMFTALGTELYRAGASAGYASKDISAMSNYLGSLVGIDFSRP